METTFLESLSADQALTAIYIGYYNRAPDPVGFAFWQDTLANGFDLNNDGSSLDDIASNFSGQEETLMVHPFFSNPTDASASAFVTELYANLFNRAPDDAGLDFWTGQLQASIAGTGDMTTGEIILAIIAGAQTAADGGFPDQETISNKIAVGQAWEGAVNAAGIAYEGEAIVSAADVIIDVNETAGSVVAANSEITAFVAGNQPGPVVTPGDLIILSEDRDNVVGTENSDTFEAYDAELQNGDTIDGGAGNDTLTYFNADDRAAISARTTSVETVEATIQTNDRSGEADNNVGGFDNFAEVDVELDAGQMAGVTRWENFDSRADLVIEDARDMDDTDGTFTGDITVAIVSTDPGNVDTAIYFDGPVNTSQNFGTLELRVLDQEAAFGQPAPSASSTGYLNESSLISFQFTFDDQDITVTLADELGVTYGPNVSFQDLLTQVQNATQLALADAGVTDLNFAASLGAPVSVGVGNQFTLPIVLTFDVTADSIDAQNDGIIVLGRDQNGNDSTDTFGALSTDRTTNEELIRLNVELDDVGKGSTGGDALFGAMSTGRQTGDQGTSDSIGIQQFDIEVDRASNLQTINSTNNALEVVNITNGENSGSNNTTTAADEMIGGLTVRGNATPDTANTGTDGPLPGGVPQHNDYGFSDVRVINASAMVGAVDITAELTNEIVEKYLDIQDSNNNGNADDVAFTYDLGSNNDEFLLNITAASLVDAGAGSREDFDLTVSGGAGADVITTNIGAGDKEIDNQGQDHYILTSDNTADWYENTVSNGAASFTVNGGSGDDVIWTHGWGDATIADGTGSDVIYTDNSGVVQSAGVLTNLERIIVEHEQIDYVTGAVWVFNGENDAGALTGALAAADLATLSGITNDSIVVGNAAASQTFSAGTTTVTVSFNGLSAAAAEAYNSTATITLTAANYDAVTGAVTIDEQTMNQAMKDAINNDPVLSQVLEAIDGPGQSLVVYSKVDGAVLDADTLNVAVTNTTLNGSTVTTPLASTAYTAEGFVNFGADSVAESDNVIDVTSDAANDVYVLSTNDANGNVQPVGNVGVLDATDLNGSSNETIAFDDGFGVDTVFNFDAGASAAEDVLDFSAITGVANTLTAFAGGAAPAGTGHVVIDLVANVDGADGSVADGALTAAEVVAYFGNDDTNASEHILIAHDSNGNNGGEVWHITDGAAASDATAVEEGTINLIGTDWTAITTDNIA